MTNFILLFASLLICGQTSTLEQIKSCEICIIDSVCTDNTVDFNISISKHCQKSLNTYFTCHTDVNSKLRYYTMTTNCIDCYINLSVEAVHDAWDYTLTLTSSKPSKNCPTEHVAHCGGNMSQLIWYLTVGLSGLFIVFGGLSCYIKHYRSKKKQIIEKKKNVEVVSINV